MTLARTNAFVAAFLAVVLSLGARAASQAKESILLTGKTNPSAALNLNDGAGYRWDINSNGVVNDGTNDAYDGGMSLSVGGNSFSWSGNAVLSADGREMQVGPWNAGPLHVYRRIHVDPKQGYCRWVDIFENKTGDPVVVEIQYCTNTGGSTQKVHTTSGKAELTDKDWGAVTGMDDKADTPSLVHFFATKGAKTKPKLQVRPGDDNLYYRMSLTVPPGKTFALCFFEAQRRPFSDGRKLLESFNPSRELEKLPPALRGILVNMTSGLTMSLGQINLPRREAHDLAVLRNGDEMLGTILAERFSVEAPFGRVDLPAERVLGFLAPSADDPTVLVALTDGQVLAGRLVEGPLKLKLDSGSEVALTPDKVASAAYRLSKSKPDEIAPSSPAVILRTGPNLFFRIADADLSYQCEYATLKLDPADLQAILLETPDGGLHRAVFRNGSVLSGLMLAGSQKLTLDLGHTLEARASMIDRWVFPTAASASEGLVELALRNEDVLFGRVLEPALAVRTSQGDVTVPLTDVAEMQFLPETFGQVQIRTHAGSTVTGRLTTKTLRFKIEPGPELPVFVGHITRLACPPPSETPSGAPSSTPATAPVEAPATAAGAEHQKAMAARRQAEARAAEDARRKEEEARRQAEGVRNPVPK